MASRPRRMALLAVPLVLALPQGLTRSQAVDVYPDAGNLRDRAETRTAAVRTVAKALKIPGQDLRVPWTFRIRGSRWRAPSSAGLELLVPRLDLRGCEVHPR